MIKKQHPFIICLILAIICVSNVYSHKTYGKKLKNRSFTFKEKETLYIKNFPKKYSLVNLELNSFKNYLKNLESKSSLSIKIELTFQTLKVY